MNASDILDLFISNTADLKARFRWQQPMLRRFAALVYACAGRRADCEAIDAGMKMIKQETGMFSMFRGYAQLSLAAMLSLCPNSQQVFSDTLTVYALLKEERFRASEYLALSAYQVALQVSPERYGEVVSRSRAFFDAMKEQHRFLTGYDDYIFAVMLGISDLDVQEGAARMERVYTELRSSFTSRSGLHGLSQVLALCPDADAVSRTAMLGDALRSYQLNFNRAETLPTLGVLALLNGDSASIAQEVTDAYERLRTTKGFGVFSVQKMERMLYAASLVACGRLQAGEDGVVNAALVNSITNILIAQQAAMAAVIASSAAAASSSN